MATEQHREQQARIIHDPAVMVGKPIVRGTRIPVERVLAHLAHTPDVADLFAAYPELTIDDVKACLAYAHTLSGSAVNVRRFDGRMRHHYQWRITRKGSHQNCELSPPGRLVERKKPRGAAKPPERQPPAP